MNQKWGACKSQNTVLGAKHILVSRRIPRCISRRFDYRRVITNADVHVYAVHHVIRIAFLVNRFHVFPYFLVRILD